MKMVRGRVQLTVEMNVINLETDAVMVDEYGDVVIGDSDQFFEDWVTGWLGGLGELLGTTEDVVDLHIMSDDEEDEE